MANVLLVLGYVALVFAVLNALSLLAKAESLRGLGRIAGGFSWLSLSAVMLSIAYGDIDGPATFTTLLCISGYVFLVCGLIATGSGIRKYRRRNSPG